MEIIKTISSKTREEETMQPTLNASSYEEETFTDHSKPLAKGPLLRSSSLATSSQI